jgi:multicomponent Na+:H+ antiporter subunit C
MSTSLVSKLVVNYPYLGAAILFGIGAFIVLTRGNLLRKIMGINVMESAIYLMFIAAGNLRGRVVPIVDSTKVAQGYINPLTSALMLTGIVVSVSVTAFSLALIVRLHRFYGTIDVDGIYGDEVKSS